MNNELFYKCFREKYLRNKASILIYIARKRHLRKTQGLARHKGTSGSRSRNARGHVRYGGT